MYEPLWDELSLQCQDLDLKIRSIWIADVWNQGQSGLLNKDIFGNDRECQYWLYSLMYSKGSQQTGLTTPEICYTLSISNKTTCHIPLSALDTVWVGHSCVYFPLNDHNFANARTQSVLESVTSPTLASTNSHRSRDTTE